MKKILILPALLMFACGPSKEEQRKKEIDDSTLKALQVKVAVDRQKAIDDSITAISLQEASKDQATKTADSIANALEAALKGK